MLQFPVNQVKLRAYLEQLKLDGFAGDVVDDDASRLVSATDNSIYQVLPAAVLYPRNHHDIALAVRLAGSSSYGPIPITARGGGTGTNGQSLTSGVVLDVSRYMNRIVKFDVAAKAVTVEPGVVLDQLNARLSEFGLFFPANVSSGTRATIGGMVATDASGKGSRIYGPTSNYIEGLDVILSDGSEFRATTLSSEEFDHLCSQKGLAGRAAKEVRRIVRENREEIKRVFPVMNRHLTGYNLQKVVTNSGAFALPRLLAGSEGTLAITYSIRLRVIPKPKRRALAVIRYQSAAAALDDVSRLLTAAPLAIEFVDERVIALARDSAVGSRLHAILGEETSIIGGMNFVEFVDEDEQGIDRQLSRLNVLLKTKSPDTVIDWTLVSNEKIVAQLWTLRNSAVGLLGRAAADARQGTAFVEDCAVPPERLPGFIREFRSILDRYGLEYGLYGHADVGCLHVRPLLDMRQRRHAELIRPITEEVDALVRRHGGLLWGEHGRGYRGEFLKNVFGPALYSEICRVKAAFDPLNILNPGKIAAPDSATLDRIDTIPLRGAFDAAVSSVNARGFERALACNGNGVCFSWDADEAICPSYKATRDRTQSPKGRAVLLREWARRRTLQGRDRENGEFLSFEESVHRALQTCLSCKACTSQCPVRVDIPTMRSRFLNIYYSRRRRPFRDHLVAKLEALLLIGSRFPTAANIVSGFKLVRKFLSSIGVVDLPTFSPRAVLAQFPRNSTIDLASLSELPDEAKLRTIIFTPDTFTTAFDASVPLAALRVLEKLGYAVHSAPLFSNGKALHVLGFDKRFASLAEKARIRHAGYVSTGCPVVGIEPIAVLMDRSEYLQGSTNATKTYIRTLDEFLLDEIQSGRLKPQHGKGSAVTFGLFLHCTEKTAMPDAQTRWGTVFSAFGLKLETQHTGCCGMAGLFGHEKEHQKISKALFDMSWRIPTAAFQHCNLATGFSCRCQVERMTGVRPRHPVEILDQQLP